MDIDLGYHEFRNFKTQIYPDSLDLDSVLKFSIDCLASKKGHFRKFPKILHTTGQQHNLLT